MFALVVIAICLVFSAHGFLQRSSRIITSTSSLQAKEGGEWPGDRLPATNPLFYDQKMDAAWGRGKYRTEIWEDNVNPKNDWWLAYAPSQEEIEAARAGFDFSNPEAWCKEHNIDYEKARAAAKEVTLKKLEALRKDDKPFELEEFKKSQKEYFSLQKKFYEYAFRVDDNEKQVLKGQPSLENEDTGYQWKNDE